MQRIAKILFWALPAAVALSSCGGLRDVRVEEVRSVSIQPAGGKMLVNMEAKITNPSRCTVQLTGLELNVALRGADFAAISTVETVEVPPYNDAFQRVSLELRLQNMLSALMTMRQKQISPDELTIAGELKVKTFLWSKAIKVEKQSLSAFAAQYGDLITPLLKLQGK
ncbi:MAG: LEA type 2 family protein [Prevotellaceae bacterium]|nr:LEA type 2 family protein [Prevotellaceae bacterium]